MGLTCKRFLLFAGDSYYPCGLEDFIGAYDTADEAHELGEKITNKHGGPYEPGKLDWYEILDLENLPVSMQQRSLMREGLL